MTFSEKIFIFAAKISEDLFLVIDQVFRILPLFSLIFRIFTLLDIVHKPFLARKTPFSHFGSTKFLVSHPQNTTSQNIGGRVHGPSPHLKLWGDRPPSPPRFPPLG